MIVPTTRLVVLAFLVIPFSIVVVALSPHGWIVAIIVLAALLMLAGVDAWSGSVRAPTKVAVSAPAIIYIGEAADVIVRMSAGAAPRAFRVTATLDANELVEPPPRLSAAFDGSAGAVIVFSLKPYRRGTLKLERVWFRWQGRLGLVWHTRANALNNSVAVIPNIDRVKRAALQLHRLGDLTGAKVQRSPGTGSEFDSLREFQSGMDHRTIDWKHSARHQKLVSKELKSERNHNVVLAIDSGHLMREPVQGMPKLDRAIDAALTLSYQALASGDRVGLLTFDSTVREQHLPQSGPQVFSQLQSALARVNYSFAETNYTLAMMHLMNALNRRALIVLLTDYVDSVTAELMIRNVSMASDRHLLVVVAIRDPGLAAIANQAPVNEQSLAEAVVAHEIQRDRFVVVDRLRRLGAKVIDAEPQQITTSLVSTYLDIRQRELV